MGAHPGSFSGGENCRWTSWAQTDSDPLCARSWILNTGAQWHMLPQSFPNYKTVHRRFQTWCRDEVLRRVLTDVANELRDRGALNEEECFIDATFVMAKGGGSEIGTTKRGKGMKIMAIVDRHGLPLSVSTHAANHHEVRLVQLCFDFYMIEAKPENLIGDRAYDSDPLDAELRKDGIEMIAPHRGNRSKPPTQDRRRLSRYMRRWLVERFFAWIQWQRGSSFAGNTTPTISSALSSLPASLSSSNDFEIGSTPTRPVGAPGTWREPKRADGAAERGPHETRPDASARATKRKNTRRKVCDHETLNCSRDMRASRSLCALLRTFIHSVAAPASLVAVRTHFSKRASTCRSPVCQRRLR